MSDFNWTEFKWAKWSDTKDHDGKRMVLIGGAYYPIPVAQTIYEQLCQLLAETEVA